MITITWQLLILIILEVLGFIWVITRNGNGGFLGSDRDWAGIAYIVLSIVAISIYGGIFWW
jgi:phage-related holin